MPESLQQLLVVLAIATLTFALARPVALKFSSASDFSLRRNAWFVLTIVAFLSPSFWLFALVAVPLLVFAGHRDTNPVALYLLLMNVVPVIPIDIPVVGINHLLELDIYRLLAFCVLIPTAWRQRQSRPETQARGLDRVDFLLIAYGALQTLVFVPPDLPDHLILQDSLTNMMRRAVLFFIDSYLVYFVVSRSCSNRRLIVEAMAAFCLACALLAGDAVFEALRHWLLYTNIGMRWQGIPSFYTMRGGALRAMASSGGPLILGYLLAIAFGFWLYLQTHVESARLRIAGVLLFWLGLLAAYSRGPWLGALLIYFTFTALGPRGSSRVFRAAGITAIIAGALLISPIGERLTSVLPFMGGHVDQYNVDYRRRLAWRSWELIKEHPWLGDRLALVKLQDLRQGRGIIDLVNTYAEVALFYGLLGLSLFLSPMLLTLSRVYRVARGILHSDSDYASLGICLCVCAVGTLMMIAFSSLYLGYQKLFYVLTGLLAAYGHVARRPERR